MGKIWYCCDGWLWLGIQSLVWELAYGKGVPRQKKKPWLFIEKNNISRFFFMKDAAFLWNLHNGMRFFLIVFI